MDTLLGEGIADAESKGFGSLHKATQIEILPFTPRDAAAALAITAVFALAFGVKFGWIAGGFQG